MLEEHMQPLHSAIVAFLFVGLIPFSAAQDNIADVVKRSSDAVVLIVISNSAEQETALGSGFLISSDGEIVTNYHVIKDAHSAVAKLSNGAFFPIKGVLASDPEKDLAIVKVEGKNLVFLSITNPDRLQVGDHVVAIGSPLGLEGTVSDGIVSALRDVGTKKWIQTTAPVSHGNSGGPLLDMSGHVIGVVTAGIGAESGQNLNFAVPSSEVKTLLFTAHQQPRSLDSIASTSDGSFAEGILWTSLVSGHDYRLRQDGEYLYVDWVNVPPELKSAGGFVRSEMKRTPDGKWRGKTHSRLPCKYTRGRGVFERSFVNWCSLNVDIEIDLMSEKRIEGFGTGSEKFDCSKCQPHGRAQQTAFTWIPK
jgi:Trypsin-like peptidase domain